MREYFKILSSIVIALICLTLLVSLISWLWTISTEQKYAVRSFALPFVFAWVGFLMFGILGSLLWRLFFHMFNSFSLGVMRKHLLSSMLSAFICVSLFALSQLNSGFIDIARTYVLLVFVVPVVFLSFYIHRKLYANNKTIQNNY